jgi:dTDP-glucose 4,6-dehydratase
MQNLTLESKTILVTGGYGFIMSNLINLLNETYYNITIINVDKCGAGSNKSNILPARHNNRIINFQLKCENEKFVKILKKYQPDFVIHGAAESHVDRSIKNPVEFVKSNVIGTSNVIAEVDWYQKNVKDCRCVLISTDEVYGHLSLTDEPWTEDSYLAPRSPYASSKASADLIALSFYNTFETNFCIVRGCNNFGPRQDTEKLIPKYITTLLQGGTMPVYGTGQNVREWVYVTEFCFFILDKLTTYKPGNVYNYGKGIARTNLQVLEEVFYCTQFFIAKREPNNFNYTNFKNTLQFVEDRKGHDFRYAMRSNYPYYSSKPLNSFRKQIYNTIEYFYEQPKTTENKNWIQRIFKFIC